MRFKVMDLKLDLKLSKKRDIEIPIENLCKLHLFI